MIVDDEDRLVRRLGHPELGLGGGLSFGSSRAFYPSLLFSEGANGFWYDPSDLSTMFKDDAGTMPAVVDDVVGLIRDKSGNNHHASQATTASKPILRLASGRYYLEFDGSNDILLTPAFAWGTDAVTVWCGLRKLSDVSGSALEFGNAGGGANGSWALVPSSGNLQTLGGQTRGTIARQPSASGYAAPVSAVATFRSDISQDIAVISVNAVDRVTSGSDQGSGDYATWGLGIGDRPTTGRPFNGYFFGAIAVNQIASTAFLAAGSYWLNGKTGAF